MNIVLGATGHIGSVLAQDLIEHKESVMIVTRNPDKARDWEQKGAQIAVVDILDMEALRRIFKQGKRLFLLNPPAAPSTDTVTEELKSLHSILTALNRSGLEKVVAESTYGAQRGSQIGDLGTLYEMEQALGTQPIPFSIIRAAFYMSNWDTSLQSVQQDGRLLTFYPVDFKLPMVAPEDIGQLAARLMIEPVKNASIHYIEGPELYSSEDVAAAFAVALQKPVQAVEIPREQWMSALEAMGFSDKAARSFCAMTAIAREAQFPISYTPIRGPTSLYEYIAEMVNEKLSIQSSI